MILGLIWLSVPAAPSTSPVPDPSKIHTEAVQTLWSERDCLPLHGTDVPPFPPTVSSHRLSLNAQNTTGRIPVVGLMAVVIVTPGRP